MPAATLINGLLGRILSGLRPALFSRLLPGPAKARLRALPRQPLGATRAWRRPGLAVVLATVLHVVLLLVYIKIAPEMVWKGRTPAASIPGALGYAAFLFLAASATRRVRCLRVDDLRHTSLSQ